MVGMRINAKLPKTLGKRVQKRRKELNLTQEELAEKVKISRAYMGFIEQGRNVPSLELAEKIARALKMPLADLF
jgi:DNA-binding XRE family transcriptional regulator